VDVFRRAHFNDAPMFKCAGKRRDGLNVGFREQIIEARIEEIRVEFESLRVSRYEVRLRFDNTCEFNARGIMNVGNEASCVIMRQADDREPNGGIILGSVGIENSDQCPERKEEPFHSEQIMSFMTEAKNKIGVVIATGCIRSCHWSAPVFPKQVLVPGATLF
jgi:hypothetical protein